MFCLTRSMWDYMLTLVLLFNICILLEVSLIPASRFNHWTIAFTKLSLIRKYIKTLWKIPYKANNTDIPDDIFKPIQHQPHWYTRWWTQINTIHKRSHKQCNKRWMTSRCTNEFDNITTFVILERASLLSSAFQSFRQLYLLFYWSYTLKYTYQSSIKVLFWCISNTVKQCTLCINTAKLG